MKKNDDVKQPAPQRDGEGQGTSFANAFVYAIHGFRHALQTQRNMRIHLVIACLAILLGIVLSLPLSSWLAVLICIAVVLGLECMNTAIEHTVDLLVQEYRMHAKHAKDCAAAAVLVAAVVSLIIGILVYGSALLHVLEIV